jgi:hypothetical protein
MIQLPDPVADVRCVINTSTAKRAKMERTGSSRSTGITPDTPMARQTPTGPASCAWTRTTSLPPALRRHSGNGAQGISPCSVLHAACIRLSSPRALQFNARGAFGDDRNPLASSDFMKRRRLGCMAIRRCPAIITEFAVSGGTRAHVPLVPGSRSRCHGSRHRARHNGGFEWTTERPA